MTEAETVSPGEAIRWLHDEGLSRLAGTATNAAAPFGAFTVDVATGAVTAYPVANTGAGAQLLTLSADELPAPVGSAPRLVVAGITMANAILVIDLAAFLTVAISADNAVAVARSWVMQLLLDPEVTITTNSEEVTVGDSPRCRRGFFPGGGAPIIHVDDKRPPVTTIVLDAADDGTDRIEVAPDGTGEVYLGARFWPLRFVMTIDDTMWSGLVAGLSDTSDTSSPAPRPTAVAAADTTERPPEMSR
ncbi:hypothetical protein FEK35_10945 [Nocardia cyriacigeorgica]|uniref:Uncharacterized protein n=1 Tax=Nocardia cyriacigeorgica TaxID=135487 RepID=A0A5R8PF42_9NOCA|nr:hypothetical protein [Nocardia cyriacigeorgica]TLG12424.1 hypothetical protein FEK35_10945 [Nocardia cyriacigeorgica]